MVDLKAWKLPQDDEARPEDPASSPRGGWRVEPGSTRPGDGAEWGWGSGAWPFTLISSHLSSLLLMKDDLFLHIYKVMYTHNITICYISIYKISKSIQKPTLDCLFSGFASARPAALLVQLKWMLTAKPLTVGSSGTGETVQPIIQAGTRRSASSDDGFLSGKARVMSD